MPAEALTVDTSIITAIGKDYGFDKIFSRQIKAKMNINDIFLGISTSGNSKNIINALQECKRLGMTCLFYQVVMRKQKILLITQLLSGQFYSNDTRTSYFNISLYM